MVVMFLFGVFGVSGGVGWRGWVGAELVKRSSEETRVKNFPVVAIFLREMVGVREIKTRHREKV